MSLLDWVWPSEGANLFLPLLMDSPSPCSISPKGGSDVAAVPPVCPVLQWLMGPTLILFGVSVVLLTRKVHHLLIFFSKVILEACPGAALYNIFLHRSVLPELSFFSMPIARPHLLFVSSCLGSFTLTYFSFRSFL